MIGGGTEPLCFSQANWDPVNAGPYYGKVVQWQYTFDVLKPTTVCEIEQNDPTSIPYYNQLRTWFESQNPGVAAKFKEITYTNDATQNPTPAVAHAKALGCNLVELSTVAPNMVAFVKAAKAVGLDATFITLGSGYDTSVPGTLGALGDPGALGPNDKGVFVGAELAAVNSTNPKVQLMANTFKADGVPANFWSEIGWVSAATFVAALKQGASHYDITTASGVLQALQHMSALRVRVHGEPHGLRSRKQPPWQPRIADAADRERHVGCRARPERRQLRGRQRPAASRQLLRIAAPL